MEDVIDFHVIRKAPVYVRIGGGMPARIDGPDAALAAVFDGWPSTNHGAFDIAKGRCVDAIARHGSAELARNTFVEAALAVKVFA